MLYFFIGILLHFLSTIIIQLFNTSFVDTNTQINCIWQYIREILEYFKISVILSRRVLLRWRVLFRRTTGNTYLLPSPDTGISITKKQKRENAKFHTKVYIYFPWSWDRQDCSSVWPRLCRVVLFVSFTLYGLKYVIVCHNYIHCCAVSISVVCLVAPSDWDEGCCPQVKIMANSLVVYGSTRLFVLFSICWV